MFRVAKSPLGTAFLILLTAGAARADGIPFKGNRVAAPATVIALDPIQRITAAHSGRVRLTLAQRALLASRAGTAPREIEAWSLKDARSTCTCELSNMGIIFAPGRLEIPHAYLCGGDDGKLAAALAPESAALWTVLFTVCAGTSVLIGLRLMRRRLASRSAR